MLIMILVVCFGLILLFGAPYLPTRKKHCLDALKLLELPQGAIFFELGCGDGTMLVLAAQKGLKVVGYELNPILWFVSWVRTRRYGRQVKVVWGNFWRADLEKADGIYVFLIDHFMEKLDGKLSSIAAKKTVKVVSFAFAIPGQKPVRKKDGLFLYHY